MVVDSLRLRSAAETALYGPPLQLSSGVAWDPKDLPFRRTPSQTLDGGDHVYSTNPDGQGKFLVGKNFTLLIAEDNEADLYLIGESLNNAGLQFEAHVASNGEKAMMLVERLAQSPASRQQGMILDLNLTTHSGFEVLQKARSIPRLSKVPIIVLTSSNSPEDRRRAEVLRADAYFCKPLDLEEFMQVGRDITEIFRKRATETP